MGDEGLPTTEGFVVRFSDLGVWILYLSTLDFSPKSYFLLINYGDKADFGKISTVNFQLLCVRLVSQSHSVLRSVRFVLHHGGRQKSLLVL